MEIRRSNNEESILPFAIGLRQIAVSALLDVIMK